jgi:hypothetical protein
VVSDLGPARRPVTPEGSLILETPNPKDLSTADLAELATELTDLMAANGQAGTPVLFKGDEPLGAANSWVQFIDVILPSADFIKNTVYTALLASVTAFMRKRFRRKHESTRPRSVRVWAPDGRLLGTLTLSSADADPEWSEQSQE